MSDDDYDPFSFGENYADSDEEFDDENKQSDQDNSEREYSSEDDIDGAGYESEEGLDFKAGFKEMQNISQGRSYLTNTSKKIQKSIRTQEEITKEQMYGVLKGNVFSELSKTKQENMIQMTEKVPKLQTLNIETLMVATLYITLHQKLSVETFKSFCKKNLNKTNVEEADLLRYIRLLSK